MRLIASICLLFTCVSVQSQQLVGYSDEHRVEVNGYRPRILAEDDSNVYVGDVRHGGYHNLYLESYSKKNLKRNFIKRYKIKFRSPRDFVGLYFFKNRVVYFINRIGYDIGKSFLEAHYIEFATGEERVDTLVSPEIENFGYYSATFNRIGYYNVFLSENKNRMLIQFYSENKEMGRWFEQIYVLDEDLNLMYEKKYVRLNEDEMLPKHLIIDDEGSLYYILKNRLVYLDFYQDYEEWSEPLPQDFFESNAKGVRLTASFNDLGNLVLTGFYLTTDLEDTQEHKKLSETKAGDTQIEGVFYIEIDPLNKETVKSEVSFFDKDLLDDFLDKETEKYGRTPEINDVFNNFRYFRDKDGTTYLVAQVVEWRPGMLADYKGFMVCAFNQDGTLRWIRHVVRDQNGSLGNPTASYIAFVDSSAFRLIFMDHKDNLVDGKRNVLSLKTLSRGKHAVPVLCSFGKKRGKLKFESKEAWLQEDGLPWIPLYSLYNKDEGYLYISTLKKSHYQLAKINIREALK